MTRLEHYREAERLLTLVDINMPDNFVTLASFSIPKERILLAAQVHATLAAAYKNLTLNEQLALYQEDHPQ